MAEVVEEMSEDVASHAQELEKITQRCEDLMSYLGGELFPALVQSYKENFMLEEFVRLLHDATPL